MARLPRLNLPNIPQHVVQRGNNRQVCFFNETDYAAISGVQSAGSESLIFVKELFSYNDIGLY